MMRVPFFRVDAQHNYVYVCANIPRRYESESQHRDNKTIIGYRLINMEQLRYIKEHVQVQVMMVNSIPSFVVFDGHSMMIRTTISEGGYTHYYCGDAVVSIPETDNDSDVWFSIGESEESVA